MKNLATLVVFYMGLLSPVMGQANKDGPPEASESRYRDRDDYDRKDRWRGGRNRSSETLLKSTRAVESPREGLKVDVLKVLRLEKSKDEVRTLFVVARSAGRSSTRLEVLINGEVRDWTGLDRSLSSFETQIDRELGRDLRSLEISLDGEAVVEFIGAGVLGDETSGRVDHIVDEKIRGIYVSGSFNSNREEALKSYNEACKKWTARREAELGNQIRFLSCGTLENIGGLSGYQFESVGRVVFGTNFRVKEITRTITGLFEEGTFRSDRVDALNDYNQRCDTFYADLIKDPSVLVYASCGTLESIGGLAGSQFSSKARLFINADVETRTLTERIRGILSDGRFSSDRAAALADYESRCTTWKEAVRRFNKGRVIQVSCGALEDSGGLSGFRFESDAMAIILDD